MNFLADGQTTKKWKIIPITKSLFFGESCSSSVVVACGRGPILFEKKLMEFHFGWWTFYRDSHSGGVVALGVEVGVGVGWVEGWFWEVDVQEAATILAQDLGSCREKGWGRRGLALAERQSWTKRILLQLCLQASCLLQSSIMGGHWGRRVRFLGTQVRERERVNNRAGAYHHWWVSTRERRGLGI